MFSPSDPGGRLLDRRREEGRMWTWRGLEGVGWGVQLVKGCC